MSRDSLVIIPTYNERENLPTLARSVMELPVEVDLLVVDDQSPDGTGELADSLARQYPRMDVLHRSVKDGLGGAYCAGFKHGLNRDYENFLEMDGDLSHDAAAIPAFLEAAREADLVLGSRYRDGIRVINWPLKRLMLSLCAAQYVRVVTGMPFTDPTSGFKCFRRHALETIDLDAVRSNGYSFQIELTHKLWRQGMKIVEIPIVFTDRYYGSSKLSPGIVREAILMVWRLLFQNGLRRTPRSRGGDPLFKNKHHGKKT